MAKLKIKNKKKKTLNQQLYKTFYQKLCNHIIIYFFFLQEIVIILTMIYSFFFQKVFIMFSLKKKKNLSKYKKCSLFTLANCYFVYIFFEKKQTMKNHNYFNCLNCWLDGVHFLFLGKMIFLSTVYKMNYVILHFQKK